MSTGAVVAILVAGTAIVVNGSFHRSSRIETPSSLLSNRGEWGSKVRLAGVVGARSLMPRSNGVSFAIRDARGTGRVIVRYEGDIPDQLGAGQVVDVTGTFDGRRFEAQPGTLVVICGRGDPQRHC